MKKIKNIQEKTVSKIFLSMAIFALVAFMFNKKVNTVISADEFSECYHEYSQCNLKIGEEKEKCNKENTDKCIEKSKKAEAYRKLIDLKIKQQTTLQKQMELIEVEQINNRSQITVIEEKISVLSQQISELEREIGEKETAITYQRAILSGMIQAYYARYQQGTLGIVLLNSNFSNAIVQTDYLDQTSGRLNESLLAIHTAKDYLDEKHNDLNQKNKDLEDSRAELEGKKANLQENENRKQSLLTQTQNEKEKYEQLLSAVQDEINALEYSKDASADLSTLPPAKGKYLDYPVSDIRITQAYGKTSFSNNYSSGRHNGVDFGIKYGNIYAAKEGRIVGSGDNGRYAYGKWIAIDHGDGLITLYGHLSEKYVSKGSNVKRGEKIGKSGNTGFSTGPHLHFSVFSEKSFELVESKYVKGLFIPVGASVDPRRYL